MPTLLDLYKNATSNKAKNEIYGGDASRIESKGLINIPRTAALLASSPNTVADIIGTQAAGALRGSANRPSDTIFKNNTPFSKPITLTGGVAIQEKKIKDAIDGNKKYFVKQSPAPASIFAKIKQGGSKPLGLTSATAASALKNPLSTIQSVKNLSRSIKNANRDTEIYGTKFMQDKYGNTIKSEEQKFSQFFPEYTTEPWLGDSPNNEYVFTGIQKREGNNSWDLINTDILLYETLTDDRKKQFKSNYENNKITYVEIKPVGRNKIVLPGTISGLSEDFAPEWTNFKYMGSPFMNYRYSGIERSIKFNVKLYYTDQKTKENMIATLDRLRSLVFPYEELSVVSYGENNNKQNQALAFSPNLVNFSITGLYTNLFGFVEELGFQIDDNVSWATMDDDMSGNKVSPYPSIIDVSLGFKVITNYKIEEKDTKQTIVYRHVNVPEKAPKVITETPTGDLIRQPEYDFSKPKDQRK